jgi:hypothetical protein
MFSFLGQSKLTKLWLGQPNKKTKMEAVEFLYRLKSKAYVIT